LRTEISYAGFKQIGIDYIRQARQYGKTHYNFWGMAQFAVGGILSSSTFLLRLSAFLGLALMPVNLLLLILDIIDIFNKGFEILITIDLMYLVFFISILSMYTARIYKNGVQRPIFIIDWKYSVFDNLPKEEMGF
jgi:polyisoprenyl-phosphate glycosyltransferase